MIRLEEHANTELNTIRARLRLLCRVRMDFQRRAKRKLGVSLLILSAFCFLLYYKIIYTATLRSQELPSLETSIRSDQSRQEGSSNIWQLPKTYKDAGNVSAVKEMTQVAWEGYVNFCASLQGGNELAPVTNSCSPASDGLVGVKNLLTVVESLDTLILMKLMNELHQGRRLIESLFYPLQTQNSVMVFEVTIRLLGGLLGAFSLTGDSFFAQKAAQVAEGLTPALRSGYFPRRASMSRSQQMQYGFDSAPVPELSETNPAEIGSLYLEFAYLAEITGDTELLGYVTKYEKALIKIQSKDGLLPVGLKVKSQWQLEARDDTYSIGAFGDSYYEYLVKRCLYDPPVDSSCTHVFTKALDGIIKHLTVITSNNNTCITTMVPDNPKSCGMEHLSCFAGGMFALGYLQNRSRTDWLEYAESVTKTCYLSYLHSPTGLGPELFEFNELSQKFTAKQDFYILRPETIESIFYLYRVTGNQMYRDWGWNIMKALNSTTRTASGFSGVESMNSKPTLDNNQWSFFLAETLKYMYLLFSSSETLPIDQWVFNTEAHVIPSNRNQLRQKLRFEHVPIIKLL